MIEHLIYETQYWRIVLAHDQSYLGRCVVILKRECGELSGLTVEEFTDFFQVVRNMENGLKKALDATMFNWTCLMNNAYKETPATPQVHWHFRPRYSHPVEFAGQTFEDPNFAHHYDNKAIRKMDENIKNKLVKHLKFSLI